MRQIAYLIGTVFVGFGSVGCGSSSIDSVPRPPGPPQSTLSVESIADPFAGLQPISRPIAEPHPAELYEPAAGGSGILFAEKSLIVPVAFQRVTKKGGGRDTASANRVVEIYSDVPEAGEPDRRTSVERMWGPWGFMPASRVDQISVSHNRPIDPDDPSKGTCIEYSFQFKESDDWQGVYTLVDGDSWGTKPGINIQELLSVSPTTKVVCKFRARGEVGGEVVTFQCGGVRSGNGSSLRFPRTARPDPVRLTKVFREFVIGPIQAKELVSLIDPFCCLARARDNRGKSQITLYVDDIKYQVAEGEGAVEE